MDLSLGLEKTVVVVTGAGGQIGQTIVDAFLAAGCFVAAFEKDKAKMSKHHDRIHWEKVDIVDEESMRTAWARVEEHFQIPPTACVCAAALDLSFVPEHTSILTMPTGQFRRIMDVNVTGTFITAKTWLSRLAKAESRGRVASGTVEYLNPSLIIIGSEAGEWGVPGNPDYACSKSAVQYGLVRSLAPDAARINPRARVNAVCPGPVDTGTFRKETAEDRSGLARWKDTEATVAMKKAVQPEDVARTCVMLTSEKWSGSTTGQALKIDGGKTGRVFWNQNGVPL